MKLKIIDHRHKKDILLLCELIKTIWNECFFDVIEQNAISYICYFIKPEIIKREIKEEGVNYYFVTLEREIIGYFSYSVKEDGLNLSRIYFLKDYRFYGLGKCVFEEIKKIAIKNNTNKIYLYVDIRLNKAISIFESWGFKNIKQVARYIGKNFWFRNYKMEYIIKS